MILQSPVDDGDHPTNGSGESLMINRGTADLAVDTTIDGLCVPVRKPATSSELGDLVCGARSADLAVYPLGGCTQLDRGLPPTRPGIAIDVRRLTQVVDYPA